MSLRLALLSAVVTLALPGCERKQAPAPPAVSGTSEASAARPTTGPLVIGQVGALTGPEAHFGAESRNGAQLAVEEANAAGGVQGRQLVLRPYDSQSRPEEAANAMTRLVAQDGALFVVGENQSSLSLAMAPAAAKGEVPMISPSSTNPRVTSEGGPYVFRVCFTDTFQGQLLARYARETLKAERVAILVDQKSDYSVGLARVFSGRFGALGGKVVAEEAYAKGDTDFRAQLTRAKSARPEVLFIPGYYSDVGPMARQARELGMQATLLGGDGLDSGGRLGELGGSAVEGTLYSTHFAPDNPGGRVQEFIARYKARFGHVPDALGALGYDAARVGIDALRRSSGVGGPALREQIARTRDFEGVTGRITLGPDRDAVKPAIIVKLVKGQPVFAAEVSP
ncbi:MAG TPA: ABC transporter substrate-binding protein [Myxococcaceae bacterium]|nr:ABC transporter substrate-binding protein [Myxococcaceae bacterium]